MYFPTLSGSFSHYSHLYKNSRLLSYTFLLNSYLLLFDFHLFHGVSLPNNLPLSMIYLMIVQRVYISGKEVKNGPSMAAFALKLQVACILIASGRMLLKYRTL